MAKYGNDFYGIKRYGTDALVDFDASPFTASPYGYGKILLRWSAPSGTWDTLRVVRNTFGFPVTPDDGDILAVYDNESNELTYLDEGQVPENTGLIEGQIYYYSIFVHSQEWYKAGEALGVSVRNYHTADLMYEYLPVVQKITSMNSYLTGEKNENTDLKKFLSIFSFEYDLFKTLATNVKHRYDVLRLDGRLIPAMLNQFGIRFEKEIGIQQARTLLRNAIKIYSELGSEAGLKTFVTAFTGYNCTIRPATNLMLNIDNCSFRQSIGFWESASNVTLARGTSTSETPAVSPYEEPTSPSNFPNSAVGFLKATVPSAGNGVLTCGGSKVRTRAIPITPGLPYTLTFYSRAKTTARSITSTIQWYDVDGVLLSNSGEVSYTNTTTSWTRSTASTGVAPEGAAYAVPYVRINSASAGEIHYFDAFQIEQASNATSFVDARRIDVLLQANRVNHAINPSFESNLDNWEVTGATAATAPDAAVVGNSCAALTASAPTVVMRSSVRVDAFSADQHSISGYVKGPSTGSGQINVEWFDADGASLGTSSSTPYALSTDWYRLELETISPESAVEAEIEFEFSNCQVGDVVKLDNVLYEKAAYVSPYFDGEGGYAYAGDVLWAAGGSDSTSKSFYYKNREIVTKRLIAVLGDYVPYGASWAVFVGAEY